MLDGQFIDLMITSGPDEGMRYVIEANSFRIIGRYDLTAQATQAITTEGDRTLNPDQQELIHQQIGLKTIRSSGIRRGPDILLLDPNVSRTHAMILLTKEKSCLCDLMSKNGTKLNNNVISGAELKNGDVIFVGNTQIIVQIG